MAEKKFEIAVDRETCIGDQLCASEAPNTFDMDADGIAVVKDAAGDDPEIILNAAKNCPVDCIHLTECSTGKKVWPEE